MRLISADTPCHYSLIWGAILMLTATCVNAGGLLTTRFALGVAEAAIAPGLTVIISMFYKRSEQPLRHAAWFLGNTCAGLFGGLLNYGIGHVQSIAPWKVCFMQDLSRLSLLNEFRHPS